jgi:hypothetical protein
MRTVVLAVLLSLGACATCREHPMVCTLASAVVVGGIAAAAQHHADQHNTIKQRFGFCVNPGDSECQP